MAIKLLDETSMEVYIWTTTGICTFLTIVRGIVRWRQQRRFYADDWWAFAGQVFLLATAVHLKYMLPDIYEQQRRADGQTPHMSDAVYYKRAVPYAKMLISIMEMFWGTLWSVKFSFLMLIKRLLTYERRFVIWWWIIMVWTILMYIAAVLSNLLSCVPIWRRWSLDPETFCGTSDANSPVVALAVSLAFDASSDIAIMVLPLFMLKDIRLGRSKRIAVQAMFTLSCPVILIAALRVAVIVAVGGNLGGVNMYLWIAWTWSEPWVAMIIVHIPAFKRLFEIAASNFGAKFSSLKASYPNNSKSGKSYEQNFPLANRKKAPGPFSITESEEGLYTNIPERDGRDPQSNIVYTTDFTVTYHGPDGQTTQEIAHAK